MLSVIITSLNDQKETNETIKSIRDTSGNNVEIIMIDDASETPIVIEDKNTFLYRNKERMGVGPSRHLGVSLASNEHILITDCHMRFLPNWLNNTLYRIVGRENVLHCATCLGLDEENMDVNNPRGEYAGARLALCEKDKDGKYDIFEGKWIDTKKDEDDYEISVPMGAAYFVTKSYFYKLRGLHSLKMWGSDESYLAMKYWLSGGQVKMMRNVKIGHKFKKTTPYITETPNLIYNKIRAIKTLVSDYYIANKIIDKLPKDGNFNAAMKMIEKDSEIIKEYREYYKSIFIHDIFWMIHKFGIKLEI